MKAPVLLKTILDICFILLIFSFLTALIFTVFAIVSGDTSVPIEVNGWILTEFTPETMFLLFSEIIFAGLAVYTVFTLRKLVRNFFKGALFNRYQVRSLNKIGLLIIFITIGQSVLNFVAGLLPLGGSQVRVGLETSITSFWFILAIGFFFVYLSKLFDNARLLKEENDLTV